MKGKHLGRPRTVITNEFKDIYAKWSRKEITGVEAIEMSKVSKATFYRLVKELDT